MNERPRIIVSKIEDEDTHEKGVALQVDHGPVSTRLVLGADEARKLGRALVSSAGALIEVPFMRIRQGIPE